MSNKTHLVVKMKERHCYLLMLPKELRLPIYEMLLTPPRIRLCTYKSPSMAVLPQEEFAKSRVMSYRSQHGSKHEKVAGVETSLLRTCRQIYEEGCAYLYKPRALNVLPSLASERITYRNGDPDISPRITFAASRLQHLTALEDLEVQIFTSAETGEEDRLHSLALTTLLHPGLRVDCLTLCVLDFTATTFGDDAPGQASLDSIVQLWLRCCKAEKVVMHLLSSDSEECDITFRRISGEWVERGRLEHEEIPLSMLVDWKEPRVESLMVTLKSAAPAVADSGKD